MFDDSTILSHFLYCDVANKFFQSRNEFQKDTINAKFLCVINLRNTEGKLHLTRNKWNWMVNDRATYLTLSSFIPLNYMLGFAFEEIYNVNIRIKKIIISLIYKTVMFLNSKSKMLCNIFYTVQFVQSYSQLTMSIFL